MSWGNEGMTTKAEAVGSRVMVMEVSGGGGGRYRLRGRVVKGVGHLDHV